MASNIDVTKPVSGTPTTQSVRDNFSAAKTEIEALQSGTLGVAPATITVGATGYDYTTVSAAMASLANKSGNVAIIVQDQEIVESVTLELPATFVGGCTIRSATLVSLTGTSNGTVTGSASNWTVPFNVSSSTGVATGDWLIAPMQVDGATQPERLAGVHNVTSVGTGVVTAKSLSSYASVNNGNTSWTSNRTLYVPKGRIRFTHTGAGISHARRYQSLAVQDLVVLCSNASSAAAGISATNGAIIIVTRVGVAGFQYGLLASHFSELRIDTVALGPYTTADLHDVSLYLANNSSAAIVAGGVFVAGTTTAITARGLCRLSFWYNCAITITGTTNGLQAYNMSNIDISLVASIISNTLGVSVNYTPALNTSGNNNAFIGT